MSDPTRLLSGSDEASDFEKELLGSWGAEQPSEAARARVLAVVGLGAGAIAVGTAAAVGRAGAAAGASIAPKAGVVGGAALAKWLIGGAVAVVAAGASVGYIRHVNRTQAAPAVVVPAVVATAAPPPPVATALAPVAAPVAPVVAPEPARSTQKRGSSNAAGVTSAAHAADDSLGDQVSALDQARRSLAGGDAPGAVRALDDYEGRFPRGALVEEAEALRVESLLAEGDRAAAAKAGARFLAAHPGSPHAARVRALLGQAPGP